MNDTVLADTYWWEFTTEDQTSPIVTCDSPTGNVNVEDVILSYTPIENVGFKSCTLEIDGVFNQTDTSILNGTTNTFDLLDLSEASYTWNVTCLDIIGNEGSCQETFTVTSSVAEAAEKMRLMINWLDAEVLDFWRLAA